MLDLFPFISRSVEKIRAAIYSVKQNCYNCCKLCSQEEKKGKHEKIIHEDFLAINCPNDNNSKLYSQAINLISKMDYDKYAIGSEIDIL